MNLKAVGVSHWRELLMNGIVEANFPHGPHARCTLFLSSIFSPDVSMSLTSSLTREAYQRVNKTLATLANSLLVSVLAIRQLTARESPSD